MSKKTVLSSGFVRGAAGALAVLVVAAGTGFVPLAGLSPVTARVEPQIEPHVEPCVEPPACGIEPAGPELVAPISEGSASASGVTLGASLSQGRLVRGGDGTAYLHCSVRVSDAPRDVAPQPVDLALVLDTSGSMASAMPLLKRATLGIVERMKPEDRLTVVTYSNDASVIYQGPVTGPGMAELERAVAGLFASGGTNISAGLQAGADALAPRIIKCGVGERSRGIAAGDGGCVREPGAPPMGAGAAKRLLLLTDGLANQGIVDASGLSGVVGGLRGRGIALSAMGLGASYNEQLLGTLADVGGGRYHFVDRPEGLSAVYAAEVEALRSLVARGATLTITPKGGAVEQVYSWPSSRAGGETRVQLGDLAQGRSLKVMLRLRVPTGQSVNLVEVADVSLSFQDAQRQTPVAVALATLSVGLTDDGALAEASRDADVAGAVQEIEVARRLEQARAEAKAGRRDEARRMVLDIKRVTGKEKLEFAAPSGAVEELELDALAEDMADGDGSERGRRAMKMSDAAARSTAR